MIKESYIPERGDIAWIIFEPRIGHEQSGRRPALILSHKALAEHTNLVIAVPITSKIKGLPYEIVLSGTKTQGALMPIHVKSIDYTSRKAVYIEKAPKRLLVKTILGVKNLIEPAP